MARGRAVVKVSNLFAALAGGLFGAGLLISGMTQPARVIGFLDITREWDPTLAFVMGGAVLVYAVAYRWLVKHRSGPWFRNIFDLPARRQIDRPLVIGAALFGIGWGLGGLCPGPGLVAAAAGSGTAILFVVTMLLGMAIASRLKR